MKTTKVLPLLVLLISYQTIAATDLRAAETNREADHAALRQLRDKAVAAINNQDGKALAPCFANEFAFTTVNQTVITNQTQFQEFFDRTFHSPDSLVTGIKTEATANILTRFIDENTGVCYGSAKDTYTLKSGGTVTMSNRWSVTVIKENGEWKAALDKRYAEALGRPALHQPRVALASLAPIVPITLAGAEISRMSCIPRPSARR